MQRSLAFAVGLPGAPDQVSAQRCGLGLSRRAQLHGKRKPRGDVLGCRSSRKVVDLLDEGCLSLNLALPPSGGTIPVNTEFAILEVAAGSPAQPAAPLRERRGR